METDDALSSAWRAGDAAAGERLFHRHFARLHRFFANKAGDAVEDLVQQTLLGVLEARERFRGEASFSTFLMAVARRRLFSHWEQRTRRSDLQASLSSIADLAPSPSSLVAKDEMQQALLCALRRVPIDDQILLELHYWESMPGPELARVLEVPEGTVRSRLRAAKARLKEALSQTAPSRSPSEGDLDRWAEGVRVFALEPDGHG